MRPHKLKFNAFGAFPGEVEIDFDALSPVGLFHIHGPTGAGKSTLLDALCFALYGTVPGTRSKPMNKRSDDSDDANPEVIYQCHHGEITTKTTVSLEFSAQGATYLIEREPPQVKKSGAFDKYGKVRLFRLEPNGDVTPITSAMKEALSQVHSLVGLEAQQFMQVVVLPQGLFAEALRADSDQRAKLFRSLFGTERFRNYTERLKEMASKANESVESSKLELTSTLNRLTHLQNQLGISEVTSFDFESGMPRKQSLQKVARLGEASSQKSQEQLDVLRKTLDEKRDQLDRLKIAQETLNQRIAAQADLEKATAQDVEMRALELEVANAERVAPISGFAEALSQSEEHFNAASHQMQSATGRLTEVVNHSPLGAFEQLTNSVTALVADEYVSHRGVTNTARELLREQREHLLAAQELQEVQRQVVKNRNANEAAIKEVDRLTAKRTTTEAQLTEARQRLESLGPIAAQHDLLKVEIETAREKHTAARKLAALRNDLREVVDQCQDSREQLQNADAHRLALLNSRIAAMSGELAEKLVSGEPCSVCGSVFHPDPANRGTVVTEAMLQDADEAVAQKREAFEVLDSQRSQLQGEVSKLGEKAGNFANLDDCGAALLATRTGEFKAAEEASAGLVEVRRQITSLESTITETDRQRVSEQNQVSATAGELRASELRANELEKTAGTSDQEAMRIQNVWLESLVAQLEAVGIAHEQLELRSSQLSEAKAAMRKASAKARVDSTVDIFAMVRTPEVLEQMREKVNGWKAAVTAARKTIAQLDARNVEEVDPQAIHDAETAVAEWTKRYEESANANAKTSHLAGEISACVDLAIEQIAEVKPFQQKRDKLNELAQICDGGKTNLKRFSLERWIMAGYLEEVIEAANVRLKKMTQGRYELTHNYGVASRGKASGLDIAIFDFYTGRTRAVTTLSGGETFMTSLCLALGTADVVQHHAGGIHIEALFIDEGFGSLDSDTLELAIDELDRLREGGRLVGIISHVDSLRTRIPAGIEVKRGINGSEITLSGV